MAFIRKNFSRGTLASNLLAGAVQLTVQAGHTLPTAVGSFRLVIWNNTTYPDPADDTTLEIVTASYSGTANIYNIIRAQEGTVDVVHSSGHRVALHYTAGMSEDDLTVVAVHANEHEVGGSDLVGHDSLTGFVANEHIDHSSVSVLAGTGMSGGGLISDNVTLNCSITQYTDEMVDDRVASLIQNGTGLTWTYDDLSNTLTGNVDLTLDQILSLAANKTFNNGAFSLSFNFTNPTNQPIYDGAFEIQASGAFVGDLLHVHQHTGNPGANTHLVKLDAEDADVHLLHLEHNFATAIGIHFNVADVAKGIIYADGKTVIGHTNLNSAVLRLNNPDDASRLIFDVEGLGLPADHQAWAFQTDRNVNGDFTLLRGAVGGTPGTVVLHSDESGNIGIGKYTPGTALDVNGVITATGGNSTNWNTAYTHVSNNGTDHSYIDQSVKTSDSPLFENVKINQATVKGRVTISPDAGVTTPGEIVLAFRDPGNSAYGFDFMQESSVSGDLEFHSVLNGVSTAMMQFFRANGSVKIKTWLKITQKSADPDAPIDGESIVWSSDGTGFGDAGDICMASRVGATTRKAIIFDYSAGDTW